MKLNKIKFNNNYFYLLLLFAISFGILLQEYGYFELEPISKGDSLSYQLFPFHSLEEILSSHRTFGLPLIIKIYSYFFNNYEYWPWFQYFGYCSSVVCLFFTFKRIGLSNFLSLIICCPFLPNHGMINGLGFLETEAVTQIFLILIINFSLRYSFEKNKKNIIILNLLIFYIYQIRPNLVILVFLTPFWILLINSLLQKNNFILAIKKSVIILICSLIILISFLLLRYTYTANIGLASFGGTVISGQATSYLNEENINKIKGDELVLARKIIVKRNKLTFPCNKNIFTDTERHLCGNSFIVSAWLSAIELLNFTKLNKLGSEDPSINQNLGTYFSINNVKIDNLLKSYSYQILKIEKHQLLKRYIYEIKKSLSFYFDFVIKNFQFSIFYIFLLICCVDNLFFKKINPILKKNNIGLEKSIEIFIIFQIISITFIFSGVLSTSALIHLDTRYLYGLSTFILPSFVLLLPSLLSNKKL
jgi:hypothetical protein